MAAHTAGTRRAGIDGLVELVRRGGDAGEWEQPGREDARWVAGRPVPRISGQEAGHHSCSGP